MDFTKAVGSGNDFIIIDNRSQIIADPAEMARGLCRRRLSIGADGLLLLENSKEEKFRMRIFNPDGSEAEMCGNGLRCFLFYLVRKSLAEEKHFISIETKAGVRKGKVEENFVTASLGEPQNLLLSFSLNIDGKYFTAGFVNTGVPHTVIQVTDLANFPVREVGRKIRFHPRFAPAGTNVNFIKIENDLVSIRTYERGVEDETLSCGTGSAAAGFLLHRLGKVQLPVKIRATSGEVLTVSEEDKEIFLAGEVGIVYEGALSR